MLGDKSRENTNFRDEIATLVAQNEQHKRAQVQLVTTHQGTIKELESFKVFKKGKITKK